MPSVLAVPDAQSIIQELLELGIPSLGDALHLARQVARIVSTAHSLRVRGTWESPEEEDRGLGEGDGVDDLAQ